MDRSRKEAKGKEGKVRRELEERRKREGKRGVKSAMCSPQNKDRIVKIDVALLMGKKMKQCISPRTCCTKQSSKLRTASSTPSLKTYSVRKSKALPASQQHDTDHSDFTQTFLLNKLKHMRKLAHLKAALADTPSQQSIFSFELAKPANPSCSGLFYKRIREIIDNE